MKRFLILVIAISAGLPAWADIVLQNSDCRLRFPSVSGYVVSWDGGCVKGYAQGQGTLVLKHNNQVIGKYQGSLKDGLMEGLGQAQFNQLTYVGQWHQGERHGKGRQTWANGDIYNGYFEHNTRTGHGVYSWKSGDYYVGSFVDGAFEGHGVYYGVDGTVKDGLWRNNQWIGQP